MDNNEILNPNEGRKVGELIWPFTRFDAVIPNQIGGDLFVWLFISLVVYVNETKGLDKHNYNDDVKIEAEKLINEKFSNIIDPQTLEKIVANAEKDFIVDESIKEDTFTFLDTYENLFSESCETRRVYQDSITGEVLPFFGDTAHVEDVRFDKEDPKVLAPLKNKEPSSRAVKKAYDTYFRLKKFNVVAQETEVEFEDEFYDEDEQTFLDNGSDEFTFVEEERKEKKSLKGADVIPVQNSKVELRIPVEIYIKDNALSVRSPFSKLTDNWLNKCLLKGRNISSDMDAKLRIFEQQYCIEERKIQSYIESHRRDFTSTLKHCQTLYRMVDSLNDDKMRKNVVELDARFSEGNIICYLYAGKILDGIVNRISYSKTNAYDRSETDFARFCAELDNKCQYTQVKYQFLKSRNIYDDWKKKYSRRDGKEFMSFKADLTDIILRTNLINSPNMYDDFLDEIFNLYGLRNAVAHDDDNVTVNQEKLDKLTKAVRLLFELI